MTPRAILADFKGFEVKIKKGWLQYFYNNFEVMGHLLNEVCTASSVTFIFYFTFGVHAIAPGHEAIHDIYPDPCSYWDPRSNISAFLDIFQLLQRTYYHF